MLTLYLAVTLFTITKSCNYVEDVIWTESDGTEVRWTETDKSPKWLPVEFCISSKREDDQNPGQYQTKSEMFLCAPWGMPIHFEWNTAGCTGSIQEFHVITSGEFECDDPTPCNIFHVRSSDVADGGQCQANPLEFGEHISKAHQCVIEIDDKDGITTIKSHIATCDAQTGQLDYSEYENSGDCSGTATQTVSMTSGHCSDVPSDGGNTSYSYVDLLNCGQVTPQRYPTGSCSYVTGAQFTVTTQYWVDHSSGNQTSNNGTGQMYSNVDTRTSESAHPMGPDMCTNEKKDGSYSSELFFCSDILQKGFVAQWFDRGAPTHCSTAPDVVSMIESSAEMTCNEAVGPCDYMFMRTSEFEDTVGTGQCIFGEEYHESRIVMDKCWDDDGKSFKGSCTGLDYGTYSSYTATGCTGTLNAFQIVSDSCFGENMLPQTNSTGNYTYIQILECAGTVGNPRPNCQFVEGATWKNEHECNMGASCNNTEGEDDTFRQPIGECMSRVKPEGSSSIMFLCPPWGDVAVAVWDDIDCGGGTADLLYVTGVEAVDYDCDEGDGFCPIVKIQHNDVADINNNCNENATDYGEKAFVKGCIDIVKDGALSSEYFNCNGNVVQYDSYDIPGCKGTKTTIFDIDTSGPTPCGTLPDGGGLFLKLLQCGATTTVAPTTCSYIINATYWDKDNGELKGKSGALPLSTDLCLSSYKDGIAQSEMYFCEPMSGLAFWALWNNSFSCNGEPDIIENITSSLGDGGMVCSGDNGELCQYGEVLTSDIPLNASNCESGDDWEESARLLDTCWSETRTDDLGSTTIKSWKVDCAGDELMVTIYDGVTDCTGTGSTITVKDDECATGFGDDGMDKTYFQVRYCSKEATTETPTTTDAATTTTESGTTSSGTTGAGTTSAGTTSAETTSAETTSAGTTGTGATTTDSGTTSGGTTGSGTTTGTASGTTGSDTTASGTTASGTTASGTTASGTTSSGTTASGTTSAGTTTTATATTTSAATTATSICNKDDSGCQGTKRECYKTSDSQSSKHSYLSDDAWNNPDKLCAFCLCYDSGDANPIDECAFYLLQSSSSSWIETRTALKLKTFFTDWFVKTCFPDSTCQFELVELNDNPTACDCNQFTCNGEEGGKTPTADSTMPNIFISFIFTLFMFVMF